MKLTPLKIALLSLLLPALVPADESDEMLRQWHSGFLALPGMEVRVHKFETTQEVYRTVMGSEPSRWKGPRNSVEMVSWDEAVAFCEKATVILQTMKLLAPDEAVRLPTEIEWEKACRAGSTTSYSFGDDAAQLGDYAWFSGNAAGNDPPVGAKKANPWGLFDMHGYIWEWCLGHDPETRAARGGAWTSNAAECRSDSRRSISHATRAPDLGFRCVLGKAQR